MFLDRYELQGLSGHNGRVISYLGRDTVMNRDVAINMLDTSYDLGQENVTRIQNEAKYEMLTGRTPFDGDTPVAIAMQQIHDVPSPPSQLNPDIPSSLEEIILRCLEKVPEMRFRDGSQLAQALEMV